MPITVFTNAFLIDCTGADPVEGAAVIVEDDRIQDVVANGKVGPLPGPVTTLDCKGATLMPGLTDAHVHICAVTENITDQHRRPEEAPRGLGRAAAVGARRGALGFPVAAARSLRRRQLDRLDAPRRREGLDVRGQGGPAVG